MTQVEYYTLEDIYDMDGGTVTFGDDDLRSLLSSILTRIPLEIVDNVYEDCLFLSINPIEEGAFIPNRVINQRHIIAFPHELLGRPFEEQAHVVLHEVAHYALNHKSGLEEINLDWKKQEKEADDLRDKWLSDWANFMDSKEQGG